MASLYISKSKYCSAVQCPKMLWLKKNKPELFDESVMNQTILDTGNAVGDLAMGLFGEYTEVPFDKNLSTMIDKTKELLDSDTPVICEASFSYDNCYCAVDILKKAANGYEIYEVKSSTSVSDIYLHDAAYQNWVLRNCGLNVTKVSIVHINSQYVRHGDLELDKLFTIEDVTTQANEKYQEVSDRIAYLKDYMNQTAEPLIEIGPQCSNPYDCGFWGYCSRALPSPNVFDMRGRLNQKKKWQFYYDGLITFEDLLHAGVLNDNQQLQAAYEIYEKQPYIEKPSIASFLANLSYPLYFLDFETFQPAIPLYDDSSPYQQIPFQYSLHWIEHEGGELKHTEFLAYPGSDPRRALAEHLCQDIPLGVCTTAYNMGFEKGRIREMASLFPDLKCHLMDIHDHICDLMIPFQQKWYYTKAMQGSYSIKYVLPALFPNEETLDYHNLEGVHNGGEASGAFLAMQSMNDKEIEEWRGHLLKYCGLDTFAMVKVWEKLCEVSGVHFVKTWS